MRKQKKIIYTTATLIALILISNIATWAQSPVTPGRSAFHKVMTRIGGMVYALFEPMVILLVGIIRWTPTIYCPTSGGVKIDPDCQEFMATDVLLPHFMRLLIPLYIAALLFTGIYFIIKGGSPRGRGRSKIMLAKLIYSMLLVSLSPLIYQVLLDVSEGMTNWVFAMGNINLYEISKAVQEGRLTGICCMGIMTALILLLAMIIAAVRFFIVVAFALFFPFLLFLYFFDLTRGYGRKWIKQALNWIFTPPVQAFFLVFALTAMQSISQSILQSGVPAILQITISLLMGYILALTGFVMVAATPLIMNQLTGIIGASIAAAGIYMNIPWLATAGGVIEGRRGRALMLAKTVLTRATPTATGFRNLLGGPGLIDYRRGPVYRGRGGASPQRGGGRAPAEGGGGGGRSVAPEPKYDEADDAAVKGGCITMASTQTQRGDDEVTVHHPRMDPFRVNLETKSVRATGPGARAEYRAAVRDARAHADTRTAETRARGAAGTLGARVTGERGSETERSLHDISTKGMVERGEITGRKLPEIGEKMGKARDKEIESMTRRKKKGKKKKT